MCKAAALVSKGLKAVLMRQTAARVNIGCQSVDALAAYAAAMLRFSRTVVKIGLLAGGVLAAVAQPVVADEGWAPAVHARYKLRFNGIGVGHLDVTSKVDGKAYSVSGNGEVSVLFGAIKWAGSASVSGAIHAGAPQPKTYAFDWRNNKKGGTVRMGYTGAKAASIAVEPPPGTGGEHVPLRPEHMVGMLDPLSAVLMLTRAGGHAPCERRVNIFDGKQRYDIVYTFKRHTRIAAEKAGGASSIGFVCRAMFEPIAGHRDNAANKAYAANRDAEVVMRPIPGTALLVPSSVTIPTSWGTGSMVTGRIDVTTSAGPVALTE